MIWLQTKAFYDFPVLSLSFFVCVCVCMCVSVCADPAGLWSSAASGRLCRNDLPVISVQHAAALLSHLHEFYLRYAETNEYTHSDCNCHVVGGAILFFCCVISRQAPGKVTSKTRRNCCSLTSKNIPRSVGIVCSFGALSKMWHDNIAETQNINMCVYYRCNMKTTVVFLHSMALFWVYLSIHLSNPCPRWQYSTRCAKWTLAFFLPGVHLLVLRWPNRGDQRKPWCCECKSLFSHLFG